MQQFGMVLTIGIRLKAQDYALSLSAENVAGIFNDLPEMN